MARDGQPTRKDSYGMRTLSTYPTCTTKTAITPMGVASRPWGRVHKDSAGAYCRKMFPLAIDANSKWLDVSVLNSATSATTIVELRKVFATYGLLSLYLITLHFPVQNCRNLIKGTIYVILVPYHTTLRQMAPLRERYRSSKTR